VVCDVWYLEPQTRRPGKSTTDFASRVKYMIAKRAGLKNVHWDGYLKYFRPSKHLLEHRQKIFAHRLLHRSLDESEKTNGLQENGVIRNGHYKKNGETQAKSDPHKLRRRTRTLSAPNIFAIQT